MSEKGLTVDQVKAVMPARCKQNITDELVAQINELVEEPEVRELYRQNVLGYSDVLKDPNFSVKGYIHAVKYVGYKLMGYTNQDAWIKTFPDRYERMLRENKDPTYIRAIVSAYNRGQMVNRILEQSLVPTWVLNQDIYQDAINTQARLMMTAKSEKVRADAANSILTHLKRPEAAQVKLSVDVNEDESVKELRQAVTALAHQQRQAIATGLQDAKEVAEAKIINGHAERLE